MASTTFVDRRTPIMADWLNDVNEFVYNSLTVSVRSFGAVGDGVADDTVAIQAAITSVASEGNGAVHFPRGVYRTTGTINLSSEGIRLIGDGSSGNNKTVGGVGVVPTSVIQSATQIIGDFNGGPVIHISKQGCGVEGMQISRTTTAFAASYNTADVGILVSAPDLVGYQTTRDTTLSNVRVVNQPSDGILLLDDVVNSSLTSVEVMCVKGSAFFVGNGGWLGKTYGTQPGIVTFTNCAASWCGGHAIRVGGGAAEATAATVPYRMLFLNFEAFYCCITPARCVDPANPSTGFISGFNHTFIGSALDGSSEYPTRLPTHAALTVRGTNFKALSFRLVQTTSPAVIVTNDVPGYGTQGTRGLSFENLYAVNSISGSAGYFNPLISVPSTIRGINVTCNLPDSTALAAIASLTGRVTGTLWTETLNGVFASESISLPNAYRAAGGSDNGYAFLDTINLADDHAGYFEWDGVTKGLILVSGNTSAAQSALIAFRCGDGSAFASALAAGADVSVTTGALAGTTGTDTKLIISADTATNRIYLENRRGGTYGYTISFISCNTNSPGTGTVSEFTPV